MSRHLIRRIHRVGMLLAIGVVLGGCSTFEPGGFGQDPLGRQEFHPAQAGDTTPVCGAGDRIGWYTFTQKDLRTAIYNLHETEDDFE